MFRNIVWATDGSEHSERALPYALQVAESEHATLHVTHVKEKLLAALRAGIKTVVIPDENAKDLTEIPDELKNVLDIRTVSRMDEVLKIAFVRQPEPITWEEERPPARSVVPAKEETPAGVTAH